MTGLGPDWGALQGAIGGDVGTEAVSRVVRHLIEDRDHHRITIDPAAANTQMERGAETQPN